MLGSVRYALHQVVQTRHQTCRGDVLFLDVAGLIGLLGFRAGNDQAVAQAGVRASDGKVLENPQRRGVGRNGVVLDICERG